MKQIKLFIVIKHVLTPQIPSFFNMRSLFHCFEFFFFVPMTISQWKFSLLPFLSYMYIEILLHYTLHFWVAARRNWNTHICNNWSQGHINWWENLLLSTFHGSSILSVKHFNSATPSTSQPWRSHHKGQKSSKQRPSGSIRTTEKTKLGTPGTRLNRLSLCDGCNHCVFTCREVCSTCFCSRWLHISHPVVAPSTVQVKHECASMLLAWKHH